MTRREITVVGAGIIGLTCAITLAEAEHRVRVLSAEPPGATTSAVAGALWGPWMVQPRSRVLPWAEQTLAVLTELAEQPDSGVHIGTGVEISPVIHEPPDWAELQNDRTPVATEALPPGYSSGTRLRAPLVDMPVHLAHLVTRLESVGGTIEIQRLASLQDAGTDVVVNCTGLGSRTLVPDPDLYPIRGYHIVVPNPGLTDFIEADTGDSTDLIAIYPHGDHVVLGGTAEPNDWNRRPDDSTAQAIRDRCARVEPHLNGLPILEHRIGLRPTRPQIRLEPTQLGNGTSVIHNYGHGGAGVSLAWGCAREARLLADGSV